jgi:hypothetical protein
MQTILGWLDSAIGMSSTLAIVVEVLLRVIRTNKPMSLMWLVADVCRKTAEVLDRVLPQRTTY